MNSPDNFIKGMDKVMESLVKNINVYDLDENAIKYFNPTAGNLKFPPSLMCQLCKNLMVDASMTPCCLISCCFNCIKEKIIENLMEQAENQEGTSKQKPSCPCCFKKPLDVQNIIPNIQMRKIISWFQR